MIMYVLGAYLILEVKVIIIKYSLLTWLELSCWGMVFFSRSISSVWPEVVGPEGQPEARLQFL